MARIRSIHPDALKSGKLAAASAEAERCYWRLLPLCDDEGRAEDDPVILAAEAFKKNEDVIGATVDGWLGELVALGLVERYEVDGRRYLCVTRWHDYQKPQKKTVSKLPPLPTPSGSTTEPLPERCSTEKEIGEGVGDGEGAAALVLYEPPAPTTSPARALLKAYWNTADPKPVTSFIGLLKVTERFLAAGWTEPEVAWALRNAPAHTINAMELTLKKRKPAGPNLEGIASLVVGA